MDYLLEIQILAFSAFFVFVEAMKKGKRQSSWLFKTHKDFCVYVMDTDFCVYMEGRKKYTVLVAYLWQIQIPVSIFVLTTEFTPETFLFLIWGLLVRVWILREFWSFKWVPSYILKLLPVWDIIFFFLSPLCPLSVWSFKVIPGSDQWHIFIISVVAFHDWVVGIVYRYHIFLKLYSVGKHFLGTVSWTL